MRSSTYRALTTFKSFTFDWWWCHPPPSPSPPRQPPARSRAGRDRPASRGRQPPRAPLKPRHPLETDAQCSPHHRMSIKARNEGSKYVW
jgi:hypothetical protein